jgi:hypothetical protein
MDAGAREYSSESKNTRYLPASWAALITPWLAEPQIGRMTSAPPSIMLLASSPALVASYQLPRTRTSSWKAGSAALRPCSKPGTISLSMTG